MGNINILNKSGLVTPIIIATCFVGMLGDEAKTHMFDKWDVQFLSRRDGSRHDTAKYNYFDEWFSFAIAAR